MRKTFRIVAVASLTFAMLPHAPASASGGTINVSVFDDQNGNGVRDADEPPPPDGGYVSLYINDESYEHGGQWIENGTATFTGVPAGTYRVEAFPWYDEDFDQKTVRTTPNPVQGSITDGQTIDLTFGGARPSGQIHASAFIDEDGDGLRDASEETARGAAVTIFRGAEPVSSGVIQNDWDHTATDLYKDTYTIKVTPPESHRVVGEDTRTVVLPAYEKRTLDFPIEHYGTSITGVIYEDRNYDGTYEAGEPLINISSVSAHRTSDQTYVSDGVEDGRYALESLEAGTWKVEAPTPYDMKPSNPNPATVTVEDGDRVVINFGFVRAGRTPPARDVDDACPSGSVPDAGFTDVSSSSSHKPSIDCAVWWQVASGTSSSTYGPAGNVTRAQMATFLARLLTSAGAELPSSPPDKFPDDNGNPHEHAINQLAAVGIISGGTDGKYRPAGAVTRAQMATYLVRATEYRTAEQLPGGNADVFTDDNGDPHETNINKAATAGFTGGRADGTYGPSELVRRDQMASFLVRVLDLLVENGHATTPR
jgi:hypothetical protein